MTDLAILIGLVLIVVGLVKRKTPWGKPAAFVGVVVVAVALYLDGPGLSEAFQEGYEAGYDAGSADDSPDR